MQAIAREAPAYLEVVCSDSVVSRDLNESIILEDVFSCYFDARLCTDGRDQGTFAVSKS